MSRIFLTGDTHQNIDISKLSSKNFPVGEELTKEDILIICGDAGFVWDNSETDIYWRNWISQKPWTTFCVCGNHEAYELLKDFPIVDFYDGKAIKITDSLYYEIRGEIYTFNGKTFLSMGGADSTDKEMREEGVSWWAAERITEKDFEKAFDNLEKHDFKVDYVLSHTGGTKVANSLGFGPTISDIVLDMILDNYDYTNHFCAHYHVDYIVDETHRILYDDIIEIYDDIIEI